MSDPNAEELLQRHKIQSLLNNSSSTNTYASSHKQTNNSSTYMPIGVNSIAPHTPTKVTRKVISPKDYVESLHQNCKSQLIYGKNNVLVKKVSAILTSLNFGALKAFIPRNKTFLSKKNQSLAICRCIWTRRV